MKKIALFAIAIALGFASVAQQAQTAPAAKKVDKAQPAAQPASKPVKKTNERPADAKKADAKSDVKATK